MDLGLKDQVAVVTGASNGIGRATAAMLASEGAVVIIVARRPDVLEQAASQISEIGRVESHALDVTDSAAYEALLRSVATRHGRLNIIVNNAGSGIFGPIETTSDSDWRAAFRLNVDAPLASLRAAIPIMRQQGGGAIVNITSIMGARSQAHAASYSASKAALQQLTNVAAVEAGVHNIRVNTVQVGSIHTEGTHQYTEAYPELAAQVTQAIPMKRWGQPEEIAAAVAFLASARASFVNGACLAVDGALGVTFPY